MLGRTGDERVGRLHDAPLKPNADCGDAKINVRVRESNPVDSTAGSSPVGCSGVPKEATCSIAPAMVTLNGVNSQTSTFTISTTTAIKAGTYRITAKGTSGTDGHSVTITLTVN